MNIDDFVKVIDTFTKLVGVLVWPVLLAIILVGFGPSLRDFFTNLSEITFKGGGFEATAKRQKDDATAALVAASVNRSDADLTPQSAARDAKEATAVVAQAINSRVLRRTNRATALWVDDRPDNNIYERQSLEALGFSFELANSTEEALKKLSKRRFDVIVSDMGRPPDPRAGYTLLDKLRANGNRTPFIIYASSNALEHKTEARQHGAFGSTNKASELFEYVLTALQHEVN